MQKRRTGWIMATILCLAILNSILFTACSSKSSSEVDSSDKKVQLVYQDWRTDWFPIMAQQQLDEFHSTHPDIQVYYTPDPEDYQEKMISDFQYETAADVFQGCCTHFPSWAQMGYTFDLRPYVEEHLDQATIDDWDPVQYQSFFTEDGKQFGLPKYHGALALYYNKDIFDEYGVGYPDETWDYDDYLDAMKRLTKDRDGDDTIDLWGSMLDITWDRIQIYVNAWGGHFVDPDDSSKCLMSEPEAMAAMEWIRARMWDDRVMASPLDVQNVSTRDAFITQQVAMVEDGSWSLKDILTGANFRIGVAPMPKGPVRRATLATTDGFGVYAETEHPDEAWELIEFLISKEYGLAMAEANFLQPARASLIDDWVNFIRSEFPEKAKEVDIAAFAHGQVGRYSVTTEIFTNMAEAQQIAYEAWDQIFVYGHASIHLMETTSIRIQEAQTR
ncbi:ABC transporter substrate-binding protein [Chloroflexota bacterium]